MHYAIPPQTIASSFPGRFRYYQADSGWLALVNSKLTLLTIPQQCAYVRIIEPCTVNTWHNVLLWPRMVLCNWTQWKQTGSLNASSSGLSDSNARQ